MNQMMTGRFEYEVSNLDMNSLVRNLRTDCVEIIDKVYVDKPLRLQKDVPIESKKMIANTLAPMQMSSKKLKK
jgi:hypothetical protein